MMRKSEWMQEFASLMNWNMSKDVAWAVRMDRLFGVML